jgi:hypothetical protein
MCKCDNVTMCKYENSLKPKAEGKKATRHKGNEGKAFVCQHRCYYHRLLCHSLQGSVHYSAVSNSEKLRTRNSKPITMNYSKVANNSESRIRKLRTENYELIVMNSPSGGGHTIKFQFTMTSISTNFDGTKTYPGEICPFFTGILCSLYFQ